MPSAMLRPCGYLGGCERLTAGQYCDEHGKQEERRKGSPSSRGYTSRWARFSRNYRTIYPLCGMRAPQAPRTDDSKCLSEGRATAAQVVDHIVPVSGPNDPSFYDLSKLQSLCHECHNIKRQKEKRT